MLQCLGVASYDQLDHRFRLAFQRTMRAHPDLLTELARRLPLVPSDDSVQTLAQEMGWNEAFFRPPPLSLAKAPPSGDVGRMLQAKAGPSQPPPLAPGRPLLAAAPVGLAPLVLPPLGQKAVPAQPARPGPAAAAEPAQPVVPEGPPAQAVAKAEPAHRPFVPEEGNENDLPDEAEEAEPEMCVICHDCMLLAEDVLLRLVCGHVYHYDCCLRWANAAGMAQADADMPCPMRCHLARVANAANPNAGNANPANPNDADNGNMVVPVDAAVANPDAGAGPGPAEVDSPNFL